MLTLESAFHARTSSAIRHSRLGRLPRETVHLLREGERRMDVPAGSLLPLPCELPHLGLVVDGLLRVSIAGPDGRLLTLRTIRPGELIGVPSIVGQATTIADFRAVVDTSLLILNVARARDVASRDAAFAMALAEELGMMVRAGIAALATAAFGSVRQRLARHLLELAVVSDSNGRSVVPLSQQELADAIGSVREVVARNLALLREQGLIRTRPGRVVIIDPKAIRDVALGIGEPGGLSAGVTLLTGAAAS